MLKADVIAHFGGSLVKTAEALEITRSAVWQWPEIVPERIAYKVQILTGGALRADPNVYAELKRRRSEAAA